MWCRAHCKSRSKPSHSVTILILADLATGAVALSMASDGKAHSVIKCLKTVGLRYRVPRVLICDQGSSLACLKDADVLMKQLSHEDIQVVPIGQGEQAANFTERTMKECKKILNSLREDSNNSTYRQSHNQEELQGKLYVVESVINSRPIFSTTKANDVQILTPKLILCPFLSPSQYQSWVLDVYDPLVALASNAQIIRKNNDAAHVQLQESLLAYLQEEAIHFVVVEGDKSKKDHHGLRPQKDDLCIFRNSEKKLRFCLIVEVKDKNMVSVRVMHNLKMQVMDKHIRNLKLLFRQSEWGPGGMPL